MNKINSDTRHLSWQLAVPALGNFGGSLCVWVSLASEQVEAQRENFV